MKHLEGLAAYILIGNLFIGGVWVASSIIEATATKYASDRQLRLFDKQIEFQRSELERILRKEGKVR